MKRISINWDEKSLARRLAIIVGIDPGNIVYRDHAYEFVIDKKVKDLIKDIETISQFLRREGFKKEANLKKDMVYFKTNNLGVECKYRNFEGSLPLGDTSGKFVNVYVFER